ncbi:protein mono-ADP-ribosyltransferase PARP14-like [Physella acuta]|uniref:protein mono-ADP-ribosyltransferase PARP14-like n=1 Tax=Physella acuta TaxID=109671 RepID=UPI0027DBA46E|nr:protein mono-ADP-ribosyltransferase PARP14-like [Physella acuta]
MDSTSRGTVGYLSYAKDREPQFPTNWSPYQQSSFLVDVDQSTQSIISDLVVRTWDREPYYLGRDAAGLDRNSKISITKVERIENRALYSAYRNAKLKLMQDQIDKRGICTPIESLPNSGGGIQTTELLPSHFTQSLCSEINEHYLFHGTTFDRIGGLSSGGFKINKSDQNGMVGQGIYQAEMSRKADQYADPKHERSPDGYRLKLILSRTLLGNVTVLDRPDNYYRPTGPFNSVVANIKHKMFREFVVYEDGLVYPEYVVTYKRV